MTQAEKQKPKGNGTDFTELQSNMDKAKDEVLKKSKNSNAKKKDLKVKIDVSRKKTGSGKQVSPGD